ncbi:MAG: SMP-30/gluconolactonase/LRE family protein [Pirellulaceae bacterium]
MKWKEGRDLAIFLQPAGYTGTERFTGYEPGTNGLMLDSRGRLVMCCHGDRAVKMRMRNREVTVLADRYDGKRLNSPNDLVFHRNGDLYFTDRPTVCLSKPTIPSANSTGAASIGFVMVKSRCSRPR